MAVSPIEVNQQPTPKAVLSFILGISAFSVVSISVIWAITNPILNALKFNQLITGTREVPLSLLFLAAGGFFLGLLGLFFGIACLPENKGKPISRLCRVFSGSGIGLSLASLLIDFLLISTIGTILPVLFEKTIPSFF